MEKEKYQLEFELRSAPQILWNRLASPSGLAEWFADDVNIKDGIYTFSWDGADEEAKLLDKKTEEYIRLQWLEDEGTDCFFEMRITIDKITKEVALNITDFAQPDEVDSAQRLWESQIHELQHILGS